MNRIPLAIVIVILYVETSAAEDKKIDPTLIVEKWQLTKSTNDSAPKNAIVEFTKNKILITIEIDGKNITAEGTYKVDKDQLTVKITPPNGGAAEEDTDTIISLSETKLEFVDKKGKRNEFTRKK